MTTFATTLKSEIARVARKEVKEDMASLRKVSTAHRSEIAALKREVKALTSQVRGLARAVSATAKGTPAPIQSVDAKTGRKPRAIKFDAARFAAHRQQLGLTQAQMAHLIGASALSIYKWESGKVHPRAAQLAAIVAIRGIGKREAAARLAASAG